MLGRRVVVLVLALCATFASPPASAEPASPPDPLAIAESADAVVVADVKKASQDDADLDVVRVLHGKLAEGPLTVLCEPVRGCTGSSPQFRAAERVIVFLANAGDSALRVSPTGQGVRIARGPDERAVAETVEWLLRVAALPDADAKLDALFEAAEGTDACRRSEACWSIRMRLNDAAAVERRSEQLIHLLEKGPPEARQTAASVMASVMRRKPLPGALAAYDTEQSVAALVALCDRPGFELRAMIDLEGSMRPEALQTLLRKTHAVDPAVRGAAAQRLYNWMWRGREDSVVPRLLEMLDDPAEEARLGAVRALFHSRSVEATRRLLTILHGKDVSEAMVLAVVESLYKLHEQAGPEARALIEKDLAPAVALFRSMPKAGFKLVGLLHKAATPEAVDALEWAAQSHSDPETRAYATRCLEHLRKNPR